MAYVCYIEFSLTPTIFHVSECSQQEFKPWDLAAAGGLAVGCIVTSYCVWFYSSRYVGEMSLLLPSRRVARFSVLDFYGNRQVRLISCTPYSTCGYIFVLASDRTLYSIMTEPAAQHSDWTDEGILERCSRGV